MPARRTNLGAALLLLLGWLALLPPFAVARQAGTPGRAQASQKAAESPAKSTDDDQEFSFSVQIQVVTVPVTVMDAKGRFVTDLDKPDFAILDNGKAQKIDNFELSSQPLSLAIVVETSSRVQTLLPDLRSSGILLTQLILGESGEACLITFDREVKIAQDFTQEPDEIESAMRKIQAGEGETHLSDAVSRAMYLLQQRPQERRKVIIIISEARDQGSKNKFGLVLRSAQQMGISVYTVGLSTLRTLLSAPPPNAPASPYPPGVVFGPSSRGIPAAADVQANSGAANINLMEIISDVVTYAKSLIVGNPLTVFAAGTGGADFPTDNRQKLEKALSRIGEELRNQYILTYRPNDLETFGFHTIQVSVGRRNIEARYRPGYVLAPQMATKPPSAPPPTSNPAPGEDTGK